MEATIQAIAGMAASVGLIHTITGPDHYIPFAMIAKARQWTTFKTMMLVFVCGIGHVGSSVLLGFLGIATGIAVTKLEFIEGYRGSIAAWVLIVFGLVYGIWGLRKAIHKHQHAHEDHHHTHGIDSDHHHLPKPSGAKKVSITPWVLFIIFVLGPCEPLIPMLIYPAAMHGMGGAIYVSLIFAVTTIATMMIMAFLLLKGFEFLPMQKIHRYTHAIAGFTILICGLSIEFLGL
jgi:sulfite exporter TauE/SafE